MFSSSSPNRVFQHCDIHAAGREFPDQFETDFLMFCNQSVLVPQSPEVGTGSPGAGAKGSCEPLDGGAGNCTEAL